MKWRDDGASTRAVREYIEALQLANPTSHDEEPPSPPPKKVSLTDPAAPMPFVGAWLQDHDQPSNRVLAGAA